ncbi:YhfH family protein [Bacillus sp. V3B]|nr:protein YhfH [Bacillus sp. V3B]MCQ6273412.1 YhfH family protein [Bacillus sp. V3B]
MIKNIVEFFRNLPTKKCTDCGNAIEEQADCYGNKCDQCLGMNDL